MSWSGIRKRLEEELLAPSLRGRLRYFAVSYSKCPDREGRVAVLFDGCEILKANHFDQAIALYNYNKRISEENPQLSFLESWELAELAAIKDGCFGPRLFYRAYYEFTSQPVSESLNSPNALVRMFAVLDRRTGKRTLLKLSKRIPDEPEWLARLYEIRLSAEGMDK